MNVGNEKPVGIFPAGFLLSFSGSQNLITSAQSEPPVCFSGVVKGTEGEAGRSPM